MKNWNPDPTHLICRDLQHAWTPVNARQTASGYTRFLRCLRCEAEKEQYLDEYGYPLHNKMKYPEGYVRKGEGRLDRGERATLRLQNLDGWDDLTNGDNR